MLGRHTSLKTAIFTSYVERSIATGILLVDFAFILLYVLAFEYSNNQIKRPLFVFTNKTLNHSEAGELFNRLFEYTRITIKKLRTLAIGDFAYYISLTLLIK